MEHRERQILRGIAGYIKWSLEHDQKFGAVLGTIGHDVNGSFNEDPGTFAPRTRGYAHTDRRPTDFELGQLETHVLGMMNADTEEEAQDVRDTVAAARICVFDDYITGCPGYVGRVMVVVWDGGPDTSQTFTWNRGGNLEEERIATSDIWGAFHAMRTALEAADYWLRMDIDDPGVKPDDILKTVQAAIAMAKAITT